VAIVEDDRGTREGLAALVDGTPGYYCVGRFGSLEDALPVLARIEPHVLLLDIGLPGMSGVDGARLIRQRHPKTEILMLTVYADEQRVFESICNGASGYLLKTTPPAKLLDAIGDAARGGAPMSPEVARRVVDLFKRTHPPEPAGERLTPQEIRLLKLLADGHSYQVAASHLHVSINTIRNYVRSVYEKLHVHSKSEAVSRALRRGVIS
jgi:DNA-binding NarL/FixJ family response regulator